MIEDFFWWIAEKSWLNGVSVCLSVQIFWHLEHKRLGRIGQGRHHSTPRNYEKTMVTIAERLVPRTIVPAAAKK